MNQHVSHQSSWLTQSLSLLESSQGFVLVTVIGPEGHPLTGHHSLITSHSTNPVAFPGIDQAAWSEAVQSVLLERSGRVQSFACDAPEKNEGAAEVQVFISYCGPPPEAWIFGAGHIALALSPILDSLGWRVVVCDDRAEFVTPERFPDAAERRACSFDESACACAERAETWLILVTRGHQHDQTILREFAGHRDPD
jgi:xanthine dehydrogenase accessory factor